MKKILLLGILSLFVGQVNAAIGFFGNDDSRRIFINNGSTTYSSQAVDSRNFPLNATAIFKGALSKTFKNSGGTVCGTTFNYRIYPSGSPSGSYTAVTLSFASNLSGGNEEWQNQSQTINLIDARPIGTYVIEAYYSGTGNGTSNACNENIFDNNGGSNIIFQYTISAALPVSFSAFSVKAITNEVEISWATSQEINNASFEIERSQALNDWQQVAKIDGAGQSNVTKNYRFVDIAPKNGINYYRLKQNDNDGSVSYSRVKEARIDGTTETLIFPNPSAESISIKGINTLTQIGIFDAMGNNIQNQEFNQDTSISIKHLKSGVYLLKIKDDTGTKTKRFVVE